MHLKIDLTGRNLYALAFLLALFLRLFQLGTAPLAEAEARWAVYALDIARGDVTGLGAQPAYIIFTSQLFSLLGSSTFLARLLPAVSGSLLVWLPSFFRRWMGSSTWLQRAGVLMAFGLALDPGLVSASRQAGSLVPALSFTLLALACLYNRRMIWAGVFAGLALLSGAAFLQGLLLLALTWVLIRLLVPGVLQHDLDDDEPSLEPLAASSLKPALVAFGLTLLAAGTLFLRLPQGVAALADTLPAYLDAWVAPSGIPVLRLPASLLIYHPLPLIFALVAIVRAWFGIWDDPRPRPLLCALSLWAGVALLLPLLYAGRQVADMAWVLIPLWALAASEISRSLDFASDATSHVVAGGLGLLLFVLTVVGWLNLLALGRYQVNQVIYWAIILGALLLGLIATLLVAATWSSSAASLGLVWALGIILGLQLLSNSWGMSILRQNGAQELWPAAPTGGQAHDFSQTLSDLSSRSTGLVDHIEVVSLVDSAPLRWELRRYPNARFTSLLAPGESPTVVITPQDEELPGLAENYRGQDFIWKLSPGWQGVFPGNFINWLAFRQAPLAQERIILWARADIFPGGTLGTTQGELP